MKKSNKILLGGLLTAVLLLSAVHIALYAKYRNGDFSPYINELQSMVMQSYPHVKFVSIRNIENANIRFGDTLKTAKTENKDVTYRQQGDTLLISSSDTTEGYKNYDEVDIQLPFTMPVAALNSNLSITGKGTTGNTVFPLVLNQSKARFSAEGQPLQLGSVNLTALNNSFVEFENSHVAVLNVHLQQSKLEDIAGSIDSLTITTDATSNVLLQTKHLIKAKINTLPQN